MVLVYLFPNEIFQNYYPEYKNEKKLIYVINNAMFLLEAYFLV